MYKSESAKIKYRQILYLRKCWEINLLKLGRPVGCSGRPDHTSLESLLALQGHALSIITCALIRLCICRCAVHRLSAGAQRPIHRRVFLLGVRSVDHQVSRLLGPSVDEITVTAPGVATCQLQRRSAAPSIREDIAKVVADAEPQLRHWGRAVRAPVIGAVLTALVGRLQGVRVHTLWKVEQGLEMCVASSAGKAILVGFDTVLALATPWDLGIRRRLVCSCCRRVAGYHFQILGNANLRISLAQIVVCTESADWNGFVGWTAVRGVEQRGNPY